jgi:hypothetical protein
MNADALVHRDQAVIDRAGPDPVQGMAMMAWTHQFAVAVRY